MKETFVSIVGRPNVGKSTLFNKFLGKRKSIVDSQEGITRDRVYGETIWCGHTLNFIDTGGYIPKDLDIFNSEVRKQANEAISESNLILFLVDGKQGITSTDCDLAKAILMTDKPYRANNRSFKEQIKKLLHFYLFWVFLWSFLLFIFQNYHQT